MQRIRGPLEQMGARIELTEGHAPMTVLGGPLTAIDFETPIASAQVKTAVLFAGLQAKGVTSIAEKVRTRDHSEHALRAFGAELSREDGRPRWMRRCRGICLRRRSFCARRCCLRTRTSFSTRWG
jgi:3-phosphoshikimate 1-carboxyvinyltransferase